MKPLFPIVVAILVIATNAHSESTSAKELAKSKEPVAEAEESEPQARSERCTVCSGTSNLKTKNHASAAFQVLPQVSEVHTQQFFEECNSENGCAGVKLKDGKLVQKYGDLDAFNAAAAANNGGDFQFQAAANSVSDGKIPNGGPFWWMNENSPFKNTGATGGNSQKFSKFQSSSFSSSSNGGAGGVDLAANPFLNGEFSKINNGFSSAGANFAGQGFQAVGGSGGSQGAGIGAGFGSGLANGFGGSSQSSYGSSSQSSFASGQNGFAGQGGLNQAGLGGALASGQNGFAGQGGLSQAGLGGAQGGLGGSQSNFNAFNSASKFSSGFTGSSPAPFSSTGANVNLIQNSQKTSDYDFEQQQQTQQNIDEAFASTGNVQGLENAGGDLQQTCAGQGYICVHKAQCNNGVVNTNGGSLLRANTQKQYCNTRTEVCCRLETSSLAGTGTAQGTLGVGSATFSGSTNQESGLFSQSGSRQNSFGSSSNNAFNSLNRGTTSSGYGSKTNQFSGTGTSGSSQFGSSSYGSNKFAGQVGSGFGTTVAPTPTRFGGNNFNNEVFKSTSQSNFVETDSFSSGSQNSGVFRPNGLKPGVPYLPPVDSSTSASNIFSTSFVTSPRPFTTPRPISSPRPYTPRVPVSSTSAPGYLPPVEPLDGSESRPYVEGGVILDTFLPPTSRPPVPVNNEIPAGCAAALKCTPIELCTAEGVISNTTVVLTREQDAYRVPLTDCKDIETGRIGKCCRDPYYTDPWPVNQLGKWVPDVFGGNDGKYIPDSRGSPNNPRPFVTARPPTPIETGSVLLNNFRTTLEPSLPQGPNQITAGYPSSTPGTVIQKTQFNQGSYGQGSRGQYGQRGQGQYGQGSSVSQTSSSYGQTGQVGIGQNGATVTQGQGAFGQAGKGQIGIVGQGIQRNQGSGFTVTQGVGQGVRQGTGGFGVKQGTGQTVSQTSGTGVTQGFGTGFRQGQGTAVTGGQGFGVQQGFGQGVSQTSGIGVTQGFGTGVRQGQGTTLTGGQGFGVQQGTGQTVSQSGGNGFTQGFGTAIRQGQGTAVTEGQGLGVQRGQGVGFNQGTGFGVSQGTGSTISQGSGFGVSQGTGTGVSQGTGFDVSQGTGFGVTTGQGTGVLTGQGIGIRQGQGQFTSQGVGQGVRGGGGFTVSQGGGTLTAGQTGFGVSQNSGFGIQEGQGFRQTPGFGVSQGTGQGFGFGQGNGILQGQGQALKQGQGEEITEESVHRVVLSRYGGSGQCGIQNPQKPYGNRQDLEVDFAEIPWQAMVLLQTNRSLLCGGVITRPDVVLTSASCVEGLLAKNVLIKGGEWKLGVDDEPLPFQIVQVKHILRHPFYKAGSLKYDAAVLVLSENLRLQKNIWPICLPSSSDRLDAYYNGAGECIVTGWGKNILQAHLQGSIMHGLNVSLVSPQECETKIQEDYPHLLDNYEQSSCVCGQPTNPANNLCKVDTGSALACTTDGKYTLRGIYSWESGCQVGNQLAAFYKFDVEWYEWSIGLIESVRFAQFTTTQITKTKFITQVKGGIKGGTLSGIKGFGVKGQTGGVVTGNKGFGSQVQGFGVQGQSGSTQFGLDNPTGIKTQTGQFSQFGKFSTGSNAKLSTETGQNAGLNFGSELNGPLSKTFSATFTEKKFFQTEPKFVTYTTKPEIVTFTTKPEFFTYTTKPKIVTYTTKPEIVTYTTKPEIVTYTTKPEFFTFTTKPKIVTYTTKPQIISYETSGSATNPKYVSPGFSFSEVVGAKHTHSPECKCNGKK